MKIKKKYIFLAAIVAFSFFIRTLYINQGSFIFSYDQARDAFVAREILHGDLKILGPSANSPGLYHGVAYFYFLAFAYLVGNGSPIIATYVLAVYSLATIVIVFFLAKEISSNKSIGLLAALFAGVSFEASQYATWLSNPSLAIVSVPLLYLSLWMWVKRKNKRLLWPILAGVSFGLSAQANIFLLYHIVPISIWLYVNRRRILKKQLSVSIISFLLSASTMIAVEFKFGFQGVKGIWMLLNGGNTLSQGKKLGDFIILYVNQLGDLFSNNIFPINSVYGALLVLPAFVWLTVSWYRAKEKVTWKLLLLLYIFSHLLALPFGGDTTAYIGIGIGSAVSVMFAMFLYKIGEKRRSLAVFMVVLIVSANLLSIASKNKKGQTLFEIQPSKIFRNETRVVDYTYAESGRKPFSVNSLTSPLYIDALWDYLYDWYGKSKYGYVPSWYGRSQVGSVNYGTLPENDSAEGLRFYIRESTVGIHGAFVAQSDSEEEGTSTLLDEFKVDGGLLVQKRRPL